MTSRAGFGLIFFCLCHEHVADVPGMFPGGCPLRVRSQVKIAELPLDSFRMLQALEWENQFSSPNPPAQEHPMPLSKSGSSKNLAAKELGNGVPEQGGQAHSIAGHPSW